MLSFHPTKHHNQFSNLPFSLILFCRVGTEFASNFPASSLSHKDSSFEWAFDAIRPDSELLPRDCVAQPGV
jgi:hypothetical protein